MKYTVDFIYAQAPSRTGGKFWSQAIVRHPSLGIGRCIDVRAWGKAGAAGQAKSFGSDKSPQRLDEARVIRSEKESKGYEVLRECVEQVDTFAEVLALLRTRGFPDVAVNALDGSGSGFWKQEAGRAAAKQAAAAAAVDAVAARHNAIDNFLASL